MQGSRRWAAGPLVGEVGVCGWCVVCVCVVCVCRVCVSCVCRVCVSCVCCVCLLCVCVSVCYAYSGGLDIFSVSISVVSVWYIIIQNMLPPSPLIHYLSFILYTSDNSYVGDCIHYGDCYHCHYCNQEL